MVPKFFAPVRLNQQEAVQLARDTIKKLGYSLESVFAEFEPMVKPLERVGTNVIPHYWIEWPSPTGGQSVMFEIDGNRKVVEQIQFHSPNLYRPPPKIDVEPATLSKGEAGWWTTQPLINPEYGYRLLPIVMKAVDDYGKVLGLPLPRPLTTNHVERFKCEDNGGWPHAELFLTTGWRFVYRNSMVNGYYAPGTLLQENRRRPFLARDHTGKWNLSETQALESVRLLFAKLGYPTPQRIGKD